MARVLILTPVEEAAHHLDRYPAGPGLMAHEMGYTCLGMPNLEIVHADE